ncbi:MAG: hypothetical protein DMG40_23490 [Acidobacteria bacterium]|nr:MAG: hypothetical protein DMG40_23490 [Acidobacteriota bacterium]
MDVKFELAYKIFQRAQSQTHKLFPVCFRKGSCCDFFGKPKGKSVMAVSSGAVVPSGGQAKQTAKPRPDMRERPILQILSGRLHVHACES